MIAAVARRRHVFCIEPAVRGWIARQGMRILGARIHGVIDLVIAVVFLLAPVFVGLGGRPAAISYTLGIVHLVLTLLTRFPMGIRKVIPFVVHGIIELIVGVALLLLPSFDGYSPGSPAQRFYLFMGGSILVIWALTAYGERDAAAVATR
jgi:hypothetical protein